MQLTESIFLETYKRFEALCGDLFSCRHGVSAYIVEMERTPDIWQCKVPGWKDDYYTLKHLRWLRNQLVHNPSAPGCTDEDVRKLQTFHARILNRQDPLAVLHLLRSAEETHRPSEREKHPLHTTVPYHWSEAPQSETPNRKPVWPFVLLGAAALVLLAILLWLP